MSRNGLTLVEVALAVAVGLIIGGAVLGYNAVKENAIRQNGQEKPPAQVSVENRYYDEFYTQNTDLPVKSVIIFSTRAKSVDKIESVCWTAEKHGYELYDIISHDRNELLLVFKKTEKRSVVQQPSR